MAIKECNLYAERHSKPVKDKSANGTGDKLSGLTDKKLVTAMSLHVSSRRIEKAIGK